MAFIFHPAAGIKTSCTHSNFKQIPTINCSTSWREYVVRLKPKRFRAKAIQERFRTYGKVNESG